MITIWVPKRLVEIDLYNVAARSPQALADLSEQSYAQRIDYAAQKVQLSGAKIVMLTGPSASGKTTSAHCVAKALQKRGTPAQVVSLDNFFKGAEFYPRLPDGTLDYENPDTLDLPLIKQCLRELSETGKTTLPVYDFSAEKRSDKAEPIDLQGGVCLVEGIHALNDDIAGPHPEAAKLYISARSNVNDGAALRFKGTWMRLTRRAVRDYSFRGTGVADTLEMWANVRRGEKLYISPYKENADLMFDSSLPDEVAVLKPFVVPLLEALPQGKYEIADDILRGFERIEIMEESNIAPSSLVREFIGGSIYPS